MLDYYISDGSNGLPFLLDKIRRICRHSEYFILYLHLFIFSAKQFFTIVLIFADIFRTTQEI